MPLIAYGCENSHVSKKFVRQAKDAPAFLICATCKSNMKKLLSSPSSISKITIDNGVQARSVEIIPNIVELNEERSSRTYRTEDE
jgi:hypothetical protein